MDRLTEPNYTYHDCEFMESGMALYMNRLKAYEDIGLTPKECEEIKKLCVEYVDAELDAKFVQACIDMVKAGISIERMWELATAEYQHRLVVLPCELGSHVYTIQEDYFACETCQYKEEAHFDPVVNRTSCVMYNRHCPLVIHEHIVEGFEITKSTSGSIEVSAPGEWGYEGLEPFYGFDGRFYLNREEAHAALIEEKA